jgi:hypothetical protein
MSNAAGTTQSDHAAYASHQLKEKGFHNEWEVVVATDYTLQLDFDHPSNLLCVIEPPDNFHSIRDMLEQQVGPVDYAVTRSKGGNVHVTITMREPMNIIERVAWQAIFGSDPVREALHLHSIKRNELNPILLFERKSPQLLLTEGAK